jgi:DNA-binding GntR family transcriptional regulator
MTKIGRSSRRAPGEEFAPSGITPIRRSQSLAAIAVEQIRELIVADRLQLGQQLSEAWLAAQLGISRTPVRDALLRLETEGLVAIRPKQGSFVFKLDATQLRNFVGLREVLELGALRAALRLDRARTLEALAATAEHAQSVAKFGALAYREADTAFHDALVEASQNPEIIDAYARISGRVKAIRFRATSTPERIAQSALGHLAIVEAARAGDIAKAEGLLSDHVLNAYSIFMSADGPNPLMPVSRDLGRKPAKG